MNDPARLANDHLEVTRRYFLKLSALGAATLRPGSVLGADGDSSNALAALIAQLEYLTPTDDFRNVERHKPLPYKLPIEKRLEIGLERDTWKLASVSPQLAAKRKAGRSGK